MDGHGWNGTASAFLESISLATVDNFEDSELVLMTLHNAKGLEFPVVFIVGSRTGSSRISDRSGSPASWKRSAASPTSGSPGRMHRLFISHAWSRMLYGNTQYNPPSRFLDEIPDELIESQGNTSGRSSYGRQSYRHRYDRS